MPHSRVSVETLNRRERWCQTRVAGKHVFCLPSIWRMVRFIHLFIIFYKSCSFIDKNPLALLSSGIEAPAKKIHVNGNICFIYERDRQRQHMCCVSLWWLSDSFWLINGCSFPRHVLKLISTKDPGGWGWGRNCPKYFGAQVAVGIECIHFIQLGG